jgi:trigger factor
VKVSAQEIEQRQMVLEIEVDDERLQRALEQSFKRFANRVNVPGFRRGRAPRVLVERMVGRESIVEDAVKQLVPQVYQDALKDQQINPSAQASYEVTSIEPLHFRATVPLQPKVELGDYRSIKVDPEPVLIEDAEVDAVLSRWRESHATWAPVERPVASGDRVGLDVFGSRGQRTIIDSRDAEFVVDPDGPQPVPGFSSQLVGAATGQELSFQLLASSDASEPSEPIDFAVKIHWVKERELPALDDEFAQSAGEWETLTELRASLLDDIGRHKRAESRARQRELVLKLAVEQATVEVPPQLIERQANFLLDSMTARLDKQGLSLEQYLQITGKDEEAFRAELRAEAIDALHRTLVLNTISEAEDLEPTEREVQEEIELASRNAEDPARLSRAALESAESRSRIVQVLRTRKVVDRLMELAGLGVEEVASSPVEAESAVHSAESIGASP